MTSQKPRRTKGQNPFLIFLMGATVAIIPCGALYIRSQLDSVPQPKPVTTASPTTTTLPSVEQSFTTQEPEPSVDPHRQIFLGQGPTGYSLWRGADGCIYVVDLREGDLDRMNVSISELKQVIKDQTGARCVFFE